MYPVDDDVPTNDDWFLMDSNILVDSFIEDSEVGYRSTNMEEEEDY